MPSGGWGTPCGGLSHTHTPLGSAAPGTPRRLHRLEMDNKKRLAYAIIRFLHDQLRHGGLSSDAQESLEGAWASRPRKGVPVPRPHPALLPSARRPAVSSSHRQGRRAPPPSPGPHHTAHPLGQSGQASCSRRGRALLSWGSALLCPTWHWSSCEDCRDLASSSRLRPGSGEAWHSVPGVLPPAGAPDWAQPPPLAGWPQRCDPTESLDVTT